MTPWSSQVTNGCSGSSSTSAASPAGGHSYFWKAWTEAWSGLSIQTSGSVSSPPPPGWVGSAGASEGASPAPPDGVSDPRSRWPNPTGGRLLPSFGVPVSSGATGAPGTLGVPPGVVCPGWVGVGEAPQRWSTELHATSRNRSWACRSTVSTRSRRLVPGISTMTNSLPWVVTSASETPDPLTRWSMIAAASARLSSLGEPSAISVIRVPPCRSSPRVGVQEPARATSPNVIARPTKNPTRVRPGRRESRATGHSPGVVSVVGGSGGWTTLATAPRATSTVTPSAIRRWIRSSSIRSTTP